MDFHLKLKKPAQEMKLFSNHLPQILVESGLVHTKVLLLVCLIENDEAFDMLMTNEP